MSTRIEIKDTKFVIEDPKRPIVFTDNDGNEFKITFDIAGGIIINKMTADGAAAIRIEPKVRNEIYVY